jgi:predicted RNA-binding protein with PIN domain
LPSSISQGYLIDGYNFLFRIAKSRAEFKSNREEFIESLNDLVSALKLNAIVVFDNSDPSARLPTRGHFDALEIIYTTKELSADDYILEKVDASKYPERITVVTSDRDLAAGCKALKANTLTVEAFVAFLFKKKRSRKKKTASATVKPLRLRNSDREIARLLEIFEKRFENLS